MAESCPPVVVTGLGVVSPLGIGAEAFWSALVAGRSGIRPLPDAAPQPPRLGARLVDFRPQEFIQSTHLRRMDAFSRSVVAAGHMALRDAQVDPGSVALPRVGVVVGTALGNVRESMQYIGGVFTKGPALASPMLFPNLVLNAAASYLAMEIGSTGPNFTVSYGEISGEQAIASGCEMIRAGRADVVLAGGGDEWAEIVVDTYRTFRALSSQRGGPEWSSPYDTGRNGVVLGEGAAVLLLESAAYARQRGASIYARIDDHVGFGVPSPTFDWPQRAPAAAARVRRFLERSCSGALPSDAIDLICGSANSSRRLDACELDVLSTVCGDGAGRVALTSIKGAVGEFGGAGALTAAATCLALRHGVVPPLCNLRQPAAAPFQFATVAIQRPLRRALQFSLARGGAGMALLLSGSAQ